MSEPQVIKPCPFCEDMPVLSGLGTLRHPVVFHQYNDGACILGGHNYSLEHWNTRPGEDALQAQLDAVVGTGVHVIPAVLALRAENDRLHDTLLAWMKANNAAAALIVEQQAQIKRLHKALEAKISQVRKALQAVEWAELDTNVWFCPACNATSVAGEGGAHGADCTTQAALTALDAAKET